MMQEKFSFKDKTYDLVFSNATLHNFKLGDCSSCLSEIERIGKNKYICVESFRNEFEQHNVQCWALTAETLIDKDAWKWMFFKISDIKEITNLFFRIIKLIWTTLVHFPKSI